ncbi:MAG TPA: RNA polymerase sigma-70 factor [Chitinophaga sp.]|uniref:RNA polymerase sigma factor n=1 Tax=Chitinophaga sp. TaxID=1869181 RepID=UPI002B8E7FD2|nr:RNA polymerase sigma-70 factor [Chitinophaga sp.]HVI45779.1 RNA polymerase sigma-70 factor [Chitinophaga sp.]
MNRYQLNYVSTLQSGDMTAFRLLVKDFGATLHYFAYSMVGNEQEAEEIVSDVFMKVWQYRAQLPGPDNIRFYLFRAVKNTALNYIKSNDRRNDHQAEWVVEVQPPENPNPEEVMISKEQVTRIQQTIQSLPPRCRQIFTLIKEDGLSYEEVAQLLDLSKATVSTQMRLATKKIWAALSSPIAFSHS